MSRTQRPNAASAGGKVPMRTFSLVQARRIAIFAQGLAGPRAQARPEGPVTMAHLQRMIDRIGLLQIDSVNVLARAHLLPAFARLGPYDAGLIDRASRGTAAKPRRLMEYWAHVAAYVPPSTYDLMRFRMADYRAGRFATSVRNKHPETYERVLQVVAEQGPITASQMHAHLGHDRGPKDHWGWNWSVAKQVLESCFFTGELAVAHRTPQFERAYDLTERVLPAALHGTPELGPQQATIALTEIAARACGIGTVRCFADYFRMGNGQAAAAVAELVAQGRLEQVQVSGWNRTVYLHAEAHVPRATHARALLAPFDPLVFERQRLQELFGMHYRIGIYTPAARRTDGYYVLPFLLGDGFAGRTDLKADRATGTLEVRTAFHEGQAPPEQVVANEMAQELSACAQWLGLSRIVVANGARGGLVEALQRAL